MHKKKKKKFVIFLFHCIICKGIYPVEGGKHPVFVMVPVLSLFLASQVSKSIKLNNPRNVRYFGLCFALFKYQRNVIFFF